MQGYTLIELLVVLAVMAILAAAAMPMVEIAAQRERERELKRALWEIRDAIDAYKRANDRGEISAGASRSGYPPNLAVLVQGVELAGKPLEGAAVANSRGTSGRVVFLRRIPRDPFAPSGLPAEQTWGLRSFMSSAEQPQPGDDVFDVYSLSPRTGLNGIPLRRW
ncbi:general secretion pathway protein GspG [beta proteobacterium AAP99]|nr:general secretion pathway protein GspG [beta proteobacterium AAP99]